MTYRTEQRVTNPETKLLTSKALAARWGCSKMHIWRMRRSGQLRALFLGKRSIRYSLDDILRIEEQAAA